MSASTEAQVRTASPAAAPRRSGLFRKYVLLFVGVVSAALLVSGILEAWFVYNEQVSALNRLQQTQASAAADKIEGFVSEIERQMGWTAQFPWIEGDAELSQRRRSDAQRLLRQVPAITEIRLVDPGGLEQLNVSRLAMDVVGSHVDLSTDPSFTEASETGSHFGPVYYRRESEPYMSVAVSGARRSNGVSIAEVNLKFIWDLVSTIEVGHSGWAYVVDDEGRLIAHPDISLVLRNTDFSDLPQVAAALEGRSLNAAREPEGERVIAAYAPIARLGWFLFVELPLQEAITPIYLSVARTAGVLLLGLMLAALAALVLARRMVGPITQIQAGAERIGSGELGYRIEAKTGDEIEALAQQFNEMAESLEESRQGLEDRVAQRTNELAEKSRQLALASEHKSQFLANMSHELRTPLNAVLGYTELMLDDLYGSISERSREVLERVQFNGRHLLQLINDVLDLSKIEAGQVQLAHEDYDFGAVVRSAVDSMEGLARTKGLRVSVKTPRPLPLGRGDMRRLTQVILNLVGNAIKFTERGFVEIELTAKSGWFDLAVRDSGPGIDPEHQERIFGEFQQVDGSSTRSKGGTGLGLAISRRIVELHRGTVSVESTLGHGSVFRVRIPIDAAAEVAA